MFRVVILGNDGMLVNLIAGTMDAKCKIVGVFRYERLNKNKIFMKIKDFIFPSDDYNYIKSCNLHEVKATSANSEEFKKELLSLQPDIVLVGTWGEKLKKEIIQLPKIAMINVHPSLLPKYRGPNPYLETIRHLETKTGITFHIMDEKYDSGAILQQKIIEIKPDDTGKELRERTVQIARQEVNRLLCSLNDDFIIPVEQNENLKTYYPQVKSDEVMLDFSKSAEKVSAHIRAFYPWTKTYFEYGKKFFVPCPYSLSVLDNNTDMCEAGMIVNKSVKNSSITIVCGDGKLLKMDKLKLYGRISKFFTKFYIDKFVSIGKKVF